MGAVYHLPWIAATWWWKGPIGAGKTSLAARRAPAARRRAARQPDDNPFLARFYDDMARFALPMQLMFLFQRATMLEADLRSPTCSPRPTWPTSCSTRTRCSPVIKLSPMTSWRSTRRSTRCCACAAGADLVILQAKQAGGARRARAPRGRYEREISEEYARLMPKATRTSTTTTPTALIVPRRT